MRVSEQSLDHSIIALQEQNCVVTPCALELPVELSSGGWMALGRLLGSNQDVNNRWWLGDWFIFGEHRFYQQITTIKSKSWDGPSYRACVKAALVARAFAKIPRRRQVLKFGHHEVVASLPQDEADGLLDTCERQLAHTGKVPSINFVQTIFDIRYKGAKFVRCPIVGPITRGPTFGNAVKGGFAGPVIKRAPGLR